ncbi:hypothetical protein CDAR_109541 [Caerostris darwini]|uniref:Uncharacterized protein n=1 Tax=Caerostris darwini TaxID=1538125 RepID=A0AAV4SZS4_9ARAC|nr:hypothetical protein CDAR_109541 [Caerostris darwini]
MGTELSVVTLGIALGSPGGFMSRRGLGITRLPTKALRHYPSSNNIRGIVAALAPYSATPPPSTDAPAEPIPGRPPGHRRSKGGGAKLSLRPGRS